MMLLVTVTIWAFGFTVTKYVLDNGFEPLAFSSARFAVPGTLFALLTYGRERSFAMERRHLWLLLGAAVAGIYLNQIAFVYAIDLTNASTTALIFGTLPVVTALFAFAVGVERLSRRFLGRRGLLVRRRHPRRARRWRRRLLRPRRRPAGLHRGRDLGDLLRGDRSVDAPLLALPHQRNRPAGRVGAARPHRPPAADRAGLAPAAPRLGRVRLRGAGAARADERPLVHGDRQGRAVASHRW